MVWSVDAYYVYAAAGAGSARQTLHASYVLQLMQALTGVATKIKSIRAVLFALPA